MASKSSAEWYRVTIERCNGKRTIETMKTTDSPIWEGTFSGYNLSATPATAETNLAHLKKLVNSLAAGTDCSAVFTAINGL